MQNCVKNLILPYKIENMTCFWKGIINSLDDNDWKILGLDKKPIEKEFILKLQEVNTLLDDSILWQNQTLSKQEIKEHFETIKDYDISIIHKGHLTSVCDSFLLLLTKLLKIKIIHKFLNIDIIYEYKGEIRKTLRFRSNHGHFQRCSQN